jgi:hypothetical protein
MPMYSRQTLGALLLANHIGRSTIHAHTMRSSVAAWVVRLSSIIEMGDCSVMRQSSSEFSTQRCSEYRSCTES